MHGQTGAKQWPSKNPPKISTKILYVSHSHNIPFHQNFSTAVESWGQKYVHHTRTRTHMYTTGRQILAEDNYWQHLNLRANCRAQFPQFCHFLGIFPSSHTGFVKFQFCRMIKIAHFLSTNWFSWAQNAPKSDWRASLRTPLGNLTTLPQVP